MATVHISMGKYDWRSQCWFGQVRREIISSSGVSASGALVAQSGDVAMIDCDTRVAANPKAAASASLGVVSGGNAGPQYIALDEGDIIRVIDV
jgi:hypothetical protein